MTTVAGTTNTSSNTATTSSSKTSALGQDQFLTLLVAQLQNQDPTNPASNEDMRVGRMLAECSAS